MRRLVFLFTALFSAAFPFTVLSQTRAPNIVLILADDLGWGDVGFNGRKDWKTPNLDKLGEQGTIFERWYVAAPVCAPSRAALITGKYGIHNGVTGNGDDLPEAETTLPEALKKAGYRTGLFGKWHGGRPRDGNKSALHPLDHGFDEFCGFTDARHAWEHFPKELWFGCERKAVDTNIYSATRFADLGITFVEKNKTGPFFLYLAFTEPHLQIEAPPEDVAKFKGAFREKNPAEPSNARYAAMISRLDHEVGRFLKKLDELGLDKNTLVVFTSDHGATFESGNRGASAFHDSNKPFRGHKRTLWEGGIRVPAIVRWPGKVPQGQVSSEIVHMIDLFPTFMAAAGQTMNVGDIDGINLLSVWLGKEKAPARSLFWEWRAEGNEQLAVMRNELKMVLTGGNKAELFDVVNDPSESRTISSEHNESMKIMENQLEEWLATENYKKAK